ncbi:MAG: periplasmic heavy metal sensor [Candidatus Eremiobacteraeota bacterium]|nr:periplasmic heavy metal sensor [Candidatus Eremiobacteraeota bacterium]
MNKSKKIAVFCVMIFIFSLITCLFAQAQDKSTAESKKKAVRKKRTGENRMKFTDEQKEKLKKIKQKYGDNLEDLQFKTMKKRIELVEEIRKENPDRKKVDKIVQGIVQIEARKQKIIINQFFEIRKILNPDQRKMYVRRFVRQLLKMKRGTH